MRNLWIKRGACLLMTAAMTGAMLTGCGDKANGEALTVQGDGATEQVEYFTRGVYVSYAKENEDKPKHYYYVFRGDSTGYTEDGDMGGIGLGFDYEQTEGTVRIRCGGTEEEWEVLEVTSADDNTVCGHYEDRPDREMIFERVEGQEPDTFDSEKYIEATESQS